MRRRFRMRVGLILAAAILVVGSGTAVALASARDAPTAIVTLPTITATSSPHTTNPSAQAVTVDNSTQPPSLHSPWNAELAGSITTSKPSTLPLCQFGQLRIIVRAPDSPGYEASALDVRNVGTSCALPTNEVAVVVGSRRPAPLLPRFGYDTTAVPTGATAELSVQAPGCRIAKSSARAHVRLRIGTANASVRGAIPWPSSCGIPVFQFQDFEGDGSIYSAAKSGLPTIDVRLDPQGATYAGGPLSYRVQLQANPAVPFSTCPHYVQWLMAPARLVVRHGTLDCTSLRGLKAAQYLTLGMSLDAPHISGVPGYVLGWSFDGGSSAALALQTPAELHVYPAIAASSIPTCAATQLQAVYEAPGGAMGTDYADIVLLNESATACALGGQPSGEFVAYGNGTAVGAKAGAGGSDGKKVVPRVLLKPHGGAAVIRSGIGNSGNYDAGCRSILADGIRLRLPGVAGAVFAPFGQQAGAVCTNVNDAQLWLAPIRSARTTHN